MIHPSTSCWPRWRCSLQQKQTSLHKLQSQRKSSKLSESYENRGGRDFQKGNYSDKAQALQGKRKKPFPGNSNLTVRKEHWTTHLSGKRRGQHLPGVALDHTEPYRFRPEHCFPLFLEGYVSFVCCFFFPHKFSLSRIRIRIPSSSQNLLRYYLILSMQNHLLAVWPWQVT